MTRKSALVAAVFLALNLIFFSADCVCTAPGCGCGPVCPMKCPLDTLKLGVCVNVLNGLINLELGKPPKEPCCPLLQGLADLEAAVCLCTTIKASILGINLNLPINLSLLLNYCGMEPPTGFQCP